MQHVVVLLALVALMRAASVYGLHLDGPFDSTTLLSLGFILVGGHVMGEVFRKARLPALLGYLGAGIVFGPDLSGLVLGNTSYAPLSRSVLGELGLVNVLAVGVIGTLGGSEIKLGELRESFVKIVAICGSVFALVLPAVVLVVLGASFFLPGIVPFLSGASLEARVAAALMLGALAVGMSPAATLALLQEVRARGRFTSLVLGIVVLGDILLVATFLLLLALARLLLSPEGLSLSSLLSELPHIALEFGWAMGLGLALGLAFILYLRFVGREVLLFSLAAIFVTSFVASQVHAETLLAFLVAGFVVQNFSRYGHALAETFERVSLPVFVIYFTAQAAALDLISVSAYLPLTLLLVTVRCGLFVLGIRLGARLARVEDDVRGQLQISFFSQGGVDLVLAAMVAEALPGIGHHVQTVTVATVLLYVLGGPLLLARALDRMGESAAARERGAQELEALASSNATEVLTDREAPVLALPRVEDPQLHSELLRLRAVIEAELEGGFVDALQRRCAQRRRLFVQLLEAVEEALDAGRGAESDRLNALDQALVEHSRAWSDAEFEAAGTNGLAALFERLTAAIEFSASHRTAVEPALLEPQGRFLARLGRRLRRSRAALLGPGRRTVMLGRLWRFHVGLFIPVALWERLPAGEEQAWRGLFEHVQRARASLVSRMAALPLEPASGQLHDDSQMLLEALDASDERRSSALREALSSAWGSLASAVRVAGTLESPGWRERPSMRHDAARAASVELVERSEQDARAARQSRDGFKAVVEARVLVRCGRDSVGHLDEQLEASLGLIRADLGRGVELARELDEAADPSRWSSLTEQLLHVEGEIDELRRRTTTQPLARNGALPRALNAVPELLHPAVSRSDNRGVGLRTWLSGSFVRRLELARVFAEEQLSTRLLEIRGIVHQAREVVDYHQTHSGVDPEDGLGPRVAELLGRAHEELGRVAAAIVQMVQAAVDDAEHATMEPLIRERWQEVRRRSKQLDDAERHRLPIRVRERLAVSWVEVRRAGSRVREELAALLKGRPSAAATASSRALLFGPRSFVPDAYERLFTSVPAESVGLTAPRPELAQLRTALRTWNEGGRGGSLLLYGDQGAGKRTMVRQICAELAEDLQTCRVTLAPGCDDEAQVVQQLSSALGGTLLGNKCVDFVSLEAQLRAVGSLRAALPRQLIVIENAERFFRRSTAALTTLGGFLNVIKASPPSVAWIVIMAETAAKRLDPMLQLLVRFDVTLHVLPVDAKMLESTIGLRHRLSGYPLHIAAQRPSLHEWLRDPGIAWSLLRGEEHGVYQRIALASGGNLRHGLRLWLAAARVDARGSVSLESIPCDPPRLLDGTSLSAKLLVCWLLTRGPTPTCEVGDVAASRELLRRELVEIDDGADVPVLFVQTRLVSPLTRELREYGLL